MSGFTHTVSWTGPELTVEIMTELIKDANPADSIDARYIEGDRPYESGYYRVSVTQTERTKK